ncbi:MAG: hypothetical protein EHM22_04520, partial [Actinobacteria bacterium]
VMADHPLRTALDWYPRRSMCSNPVRPPRTLVALVLAAMLAAACSPASGESGSTTSSPAGPSPSPSPGPELTKLEQAQLHLKHLVFIVQENRSFDHYFGTFPGANGFPMRNGRPSVCVPDPIAHACVRPYHSSEQLQEGGPHAQRHSELDVNGGRMDGFVRTVVDSPLYCADHRGASRCRDYLGPQGQPDVMSYHTAKEIPNYWRYAKTFVLQDRMFAPADSWTLPAHLFLVSAWAARCSDARDPMSCVSNLELVEQFQTMRSHEDVPIWAWTDITYLLWEHGVEWGYYVGDDTCFFDPCPDQGRTTHRLAAEPVAVVHDDQGDGPDGSDPGPREVLQGRRERDLAVGLVGHAVQRGRRAPRVGRADLEGSGPRHARRERPDEGSRLERDRGLPHVGRLGGFLRSREAPSGGPERVRDPRPRAADQPVGSRGLDRLADAVVRRLPEAHRGPVPR